MGLPFLKSAVAVLEGSKEPLAAEEIVERAVKDGLLKCDATGAASATMKGVLTNNIRQKGAGSHFVALADGRFKLHKSGAATSRRTGSTRSATQKSSAPPAAKAGAEPSPQQLTGAGGERLVAGHLNMLGYDTAVPEPDEGIDIVATRKGISYSLQVKTSRGRGGYYMFKVRKSTHEKIAGKETHYVFVLGNDRNNVIVVVPYAEIQKQINVGNVQLKNQHYEIKMRLNTVSLGSQRADMSGYNDAWPEAE